MRETTIRQKGPLGSIPRGGSTEKVEESSTSTTPTEQRSVKSAKVVECRIETEGMCEAGKGCLQCDGLRQTHGKNGVPPLSAISRCEKHGEYLPCGMCASAPCACGKDERCDACYVERGPLPPRVCRGIPIAQGPEDACTCALGPEVQGDRCAPCAEWMRLCGQCDGCNGHLPGWTVTGILCGDCRDLRLATSKRTPAMNAPLLKRIDDLIREGLEKAWEGLADCEDLDPRTVAACKRLRDLERGL